MDYKEKYEQALSVARNLYNDAKKMDYKQDMEDYEQIFPELAESEDEKVRKELIAYFEVYPKGYFGELKKSHILAWLEKQGNFKPQWLSNFITDHHKSIGLEKVDEINPSEFEIGLRCLLKQFEVLPKEDLVDGLSFYLNVVKNDGKYVAEQKPKEWSEKDECYMSECISAIATKDGWSFEEKRKTKHWLKSLKERIKHD